MLTPLKSYPNYPSGSREAVLEQWAERAHVRGHTPPPAAPPRRVARPFVDVDPDRLRAEIQHLNNVRV